MDNNVVHGWAINPEKTDEPAKVDLLVDDVIVEELTADLYREDLKKADLREGYAAFRYRIPLSFYDGRQHYIRTIHKDAGVAMPGCLEFCQGLKNSPLLRTKIDWANKGLVMKTSPRIESLPGRVKAKKRIALLSTFHSSARFYAYHESLAKILSDAGFVVVIVHAGNNFSQSLMEIDDDDCFLYIKRNIGYDFGSWAVGAYMLADILEEPDEILLINDSVVSTTGDISGLLERARSCKADLVGLTDSYERNYHMQSYFLWLGPNICHSPYLGLFMAQYSFSSNKETVIEEGELGFTKFFLDQGFTAKAIFQYEQVAGAWMQDAPAVARSIENLPVFDRLKAKTDAKASYRDQMLSKLDDISCSIVRGVPLNPTHFFWDTLIANFQFPFLKRELVLKNPADVPSYFRLAEFLGGWSEEVCANILDIHRRYGGTRVPYLSRRS